MVPSPPAVSKAASSATDTNTGGLMSMLRPKLGEAELATNVVPPAVGTKILADRDGAKLVITPSG